MADHRAIADAGQSLVDLLRSSLALDGGDDAIVLGSPATVGGGPGPGGGGGGGTTPRLSVYLYRVEPNADLRNVPRRVADAPGDGDPTTVTPAPLALDLHYLLTAYPSGSTGGGTGGGTTGDTWDQHRVLGWAMGTLADHPTLQGDDLAGSLADDPPIHVTPEVTRFEDVVDVWSTFTDRPYEPSIGYLLSPVLVDSTLGTSGRRVTEREFETLQVAPGERPDEEGAESDEDG
jgi:hypothetical protein